MPTGRIPSLFDLALVRGHRGIADFDGGIFTSDAPLLGATNRVLGLTSHLVPCFKDRHHFDLIEHTIETLPIRRITRIALGSDDLIDYDRMCYDSIMVMLASKLTAGRPGRAPTAASAARP